jgi:alpha-glucosidase (family GH31 glycosyl hydrolase)
MVETQVLIGKFLMTTPIVYPGHDQRDVYFPGSG